ncbi:SDR family oxidoreductase [Rhodococcus sp. D2-41]|uniref:SDR family oxidoreductase n=1 Tax=Speluncibacter jeojiensis TaxID=2710754 RepID=A0A9X4M5S0_9ACTN|nr:SDR family oxidoreductase [Rhodococcus sp. D2-41]MDG3010270.1 SDR family oxidoreductase [Rhodococcus sp. D2-41]MDG3015783.1 SDR family oxidoreductase [Corynebacteriales bacterium D3-21]
MATYALTGTASGLGAATRERLQSAGHRVIGVDRAGADVNVDLGSAAGRAEAVERVAELAAGSLDGFVPFAGLASTGGRAGSLLVAVNYFGAIEVLEGLRSLLAAGQDSSVVLISSNSTTTQPNWPVELAEACLAGDEDKARSLADGFGDLGGLQAYPATKAALAYYARTRSAEYIAQGIRLNAIAPGLIDTPMTDGLRGDQVTGAAIEQFIASTPIGRGGRPDEVAALVAFLLGAESSYFVGSVLFMDGGVDAAFRGKDWPRVWDLA